MLHEPSNSRLPVASRTGGQVLRAHGFLGLLIALAGASGGCTIIIGERPEGTDVGLDADTDVDAGSSGLPERPQDEPDADVATDAGESDASKQDAGTFDAGARADSGDADSATEETEASMEAAVDASEDAGEDAGTVADASDGDTGPSCTAPVTWYPDGDEDGYGGDGEARQACSKPSGSWSRTNDDCHDDNVEVHPGQTGYFEIAYTKLTGGDSFDYDCSTQEEGKPGQASLENGCMSLLGLGLDCNDLSGYMPRPDRTGSGRNAMCGSTILARCQGTLLSCTPGSPGLAPAPYACR